MGTNHTFLRVEVVELHAEHIYTYWCPSGVLSFLASTEKPSVVHLMVDRENSNLSTSDD